MAVGTSEVLALTVRGSSAPEPFSGLEKVGIGIRSPRATVTVMASWSLPVLENTNRKEDVKPLSSTEKTRKDTSYIAKMIYISKLSLVKLYTRFVCCIVCMFFFVPFHVVAVFSEN